MLTPSPILSEVKHFHLACGSGLGARGFQEAHARVGQLEAHMRCLGGIDVDPNACRDFERMTGTPATCRDLFTLDQFRAYHGPCVTGKRRCPVCANTGAPPAGWVEATGEDLRVAAQGETPNIVFASSPCKGLSGLLSPSLAESSRYQALNALTLRCVQLMCEAWASDPVPLFIFENVPLIATRGRGLLDEIKDLLYLHGYSVAETFHDCGALGGLGQHRRRFLLVARHRVKVPPFLYEPPKQRVRGVGEVIGPLPMPDDPAGGPMHRCPRLTWETWVRLALIPAGGDWRSLEGMDFTKLGIEPLGAREWGRGDLGVTPWTNPAGAVTAGSGPSSGGQAVGDVRPGGQGTYQTYRVIRFNEPTPTVTAQSEPGNGGYTVADPRIATDWGDSKYHVAKYDEPARTVIAANGTGHGAWSVADPRVTSKATSEHFKTAGHYGVVEWRESAHAVTAHGQHDNGAFSVADPRPLPDQHDRPDPVPVIFALDGTWHRPFTTLELAVLQDFPLDVLLAHGLTGTSHMTWREHIGNAVPRASARAIGSEMARTLLMARAGKTFVLSAAPVWVQPLAIGMSMDAPDQFQYIRQP